MCGVIKVVFAEGDFTTYLKCVLNSARWKIGISGIQ